MFIVFLWIVVGISLSFLAGWVVGKYGHHSVPEVEAQLLIASELARVNRRLWK